MWHVAVVVARCIVTFPFLANKWLNSKFITVACYCADGPNVGSTTVLSVVYCDTIPTLGQRFSKLIKITNIQPQQENMQSRIKWLFYNHYTPLSPLANYSCQWGHTSSVYVKA